MHCASRKHSCWEQPPPLPSCYLLRPVAPLSLSLVQEDSIPNPRVSRELERFHRWTPWNHAILAVEWPVLTTTFMCLSGEPAGHMFLIEVNFTEDFPFEPVTIVVTPGLGGEARTTLNPFCGGDFSPAMTVRQYVLDAEVTISATPEAKGLEGGAEYWLTGVSEVEKLHKAVLPLLENPGELKSALGRFLTLSK